LWLLELLIDSVEVPLLIFEDDSVTELTALSREDSPDSFTPASLALFNPEPLALICELCLELPLAPDLECFECECELDAPLRLLLDGRDDDSPSFLLDDSWIPLFE
jgi:hypothetical protein